MNTRYAWMAGVAALGLALATPALANPNGLDESFRLAARDSRDDVRQDQRNDKQDTRSSNKREAGRNEPQGYGYGYERRQQQDQGDSKDRSSRQPRH